jgi:hypothetical protein
MRNPLLMGINVHRNASTVVLMELTGDEAAPRFAVNNNRPGAATLRRLSTPSPRNTAITPSHGRRHHRRLALWFGCDPPQPISATGGTKCYGS